MLSREAQPVESPDQLIQIQSTPHSDRLLAVAVLGRMLPDQMAMNGEAPGPVDAGPGVQKADPSRRGECAASWLFVVPSLVQDLIPDVQVSFEVM